MIVSVYATGNTEPLATFEIVETLLPSALFDPALLDFSDGGGQRRTLSVSVDSRLAPEAEWPALVSSDPAIRLILLPGQSNSAAKLRQLTRQ